MNSIITGEQRRLSRKYFAYEIFSNLWFISATWLYFYRLFITDQQVGVLDGFAFAVGLLAEVPSGVLADRFGRDKLVKLGLLLMGAGFLIQAFGSSFTAFFIGQAIMMVGVSFMSGADEALFFGELNFDRASTNWRKLVTRGSQLSLACTIVATVIGGWLYTINPRLPFILTILPIIVSIIIIWPIKETRPKKPHQKFLIEFQKHLQDIKIGFKQFYLPKLWLYVPIILAVQGLFYTAGWGLLRIMLLNQFHFTPFWGSVVISSSALITVGILALMHRFAENISEKKVIILISLAASASLLLSLADIGIWGYFVIFILYAGEHTLYPFMSEVLNNKAPEDQRATILSVASFLRTLPYVILAPIIGYLNTQGKLSYFLIIWSLLILAAVLVYLFLKKNDDKITLVKPKIETEAWQLPGNL